MQQPLQLSPGTVKRSRVHNPYAWGFASKAAQSTRQQQMSKSAAAAAAAAAAAGTESHPMLPLVPSASDVHEQQHRVTVDDIINNTAQYKSVEEIAGEIMRGSSLSLRPEQARAVARNFFNHTVNKPLAEVATCVPYPTSDVFRRLMLDVTNTIIGTSFPPPKTHLVNSADINSVTLLLDHLPFNVTHDQIRAMLNIFTGINPLSAVIHVDKRGRRNGSAWVQVPASEAARVMEILHKRVLFDQGGWLFAAPSGDERRDLFDRMVHLMKRSVKQAQSTRFMDDVAAYRNLPYEAISCVQANYDKDIVKKTDSPFDKRERPLPRFLPDAAAAAAAGTGTGTAALPGTLDRYMTSFAPECYGRIVRDQQQTGEEQLFCLYAELPQFMPVHSQRHSQMLHPNWSYVYAANNTLRRTLWIEEEQQCSGALLG